MLYCAEIDFIASKIKINLYLVKSSHGDLDSGLMQPYCTRTSVDVNNAFIQRIYKCALSKNYVQQILHNEKRYNEPIPILVVLLIKLRSNVQIFLIWPFMPMPFLTVLLTFGGVTARMGTNGAAPLPKSSAAFQ